jgi:3-oxoacyl-[acyl-carrier protein] reductase
VETGLSGKSAIVTGGARGIGLACARALASEGVGVLLADLDGEAASEAAMELGGEHGGVAVDVTSKPDVERMVDVAVGRFGRLDVLVCCAGIFHDTPFDRIDPDEWDRIVAVNLRGTFLSAQAALRPMVSQGSGRVILIASLAAQSGGLAAGAAYAASKGGVASLAKSIARYAGPHGITVNCVNPGVIDTPMIANWAPDARERTVGATSLGRVGTAEEVASTVVWLASDGAGFVHGAHVDVNGGLLMD